MIIMLDGTCAELNEVQQRLSQHFEILSANDYNEQEANGRRYIRAKLKPGPGPDSQSLFDLIQAMLADSHQEIQEAINIPAEMDGYYAGYQAALMEMAQRAGLVPTADESLAELYEQVRAGKLTEQMLVEVNEGAPDPEHGKEEICVNCGNAIKYSQFSGWWHTDLEPMIFDPKTKSILGVCGKSEPAPAKRKRSRNG